MRTQSEPLRIYLGGGSSYHSLYFILLLGPPVPSKQLARLPRQGLEANVSLRLVRREEV